MTGLSPTPVFFAPQQTEGESLKKKVLEREKGTIYDLKQSEHFKLSSFKKILARAVIDHFP